MDSHTDLECTRIAELLGEYLEGTLPRDTAELLEWHLEGCGPCIAFVNTYRGTINAARTLREVEIPRELKSRLIAFLRVSELGGGLRPPSDASPRDR